MERNGKDLGLPSVGIEKLKEVLNLDDITLKTLGKEGRKNVLKKFDIEKMCNSTIAEYRKLIN